MCIYVWVSACGSCFCTYAKYNGVYKEMLLPMLLLLASWQFEWITLNFSFSFILSNILLFFRRQRFSLQPDTLKRRKYSFPKRKRKMSRSCKPVLWDSFRLHNKISIRFWSRSQFFLSVSFYLNLSLTLLLSFNVSLPI